MISPLKKKKGPRSVRVFVACARDASVSMAARHLYTILETYKGKGGCFPSASSLAKDAGANIKTVWAWLAELEKAGWVERRHRNARGQRSSNHYELWADKKAAKLTTHAMTQKTGHGSMTQKTGVRLPDPKNGSGATLDNITASPVLAEDAKAPSALPANVISMPKQAMG